MYPQVKRHMDSRVRRFVHLESERPQGTGSNPPPREWCLRTSRAAEPSLWGSAVSFSATGQKVDYVLITVVFGENCFEPSLRSLVGSRLLGPNRPAGLWPRRPLSGSGRRRAGTHSPRRVRGTRSASGCRKRAVGCGSRRSSRTGRGAACVGDFGHPRYGRISPVGADDHPGGQLVLGVLPVRAADSGWPLVRTDHRGDGLAEQGPPRVSVRRVRAVSGRAFPCGCRSRSADAW